MSETLPRADSGRIQATPPTDDELETLAAGTQLLRIHPLAGAHPVAWNEFRFFGPTRSRFDHQTEPARVHPSRGIMYTTTGGEAFNAALAEYFQDGTGTVGPIDRVHHMVAVTAFSLAEPVVLLNLNSGWVTRAGGNQAIISGRRSRAREWARAIYRHYSSVAGVSYTSSIWGPGHCVALWERAAPALPATNDLHRVLSDPALDGPVATAAHDLGTVLVP